MVFIWHMARRELRSSWRRLLFFFLCIGIGVGSIVALRSMIRNLDTAVAVEARELLTADVQVESTRAWKPETLDAIEQAAARVAVEARTETIESSTMARPADEGREGAMMVELKGVEAQFPLAGEFRLAGGEQFRGAMLAEQGAVVAPLLLERLGLRVGEWVRIGNATFQIRGVIEREPGAGGGFRLGPRVLVERTSIEAAGLTGFGSRARRKILFRTQAGRAEELVAALRAGVNDKLVTVRSYRDAQESLSEQFARAENYLSLTGLVVLVLGGIGVSSVTRVFIEQKRKSIAVLKCLGGTAGRITSAYLAQVLVLGLLGSLLGVVLATGALLFIERRFGESFPAHMNYGLVGGAILQGIGLGLLISLLFSALPLLRIRHIKPNMLLRDEAGAGGRRFDRLTWLVGACAGAGLLALASWQAGSLRVGAFFIAGLALTAGVLYAAALALTSLLRRFRGTGSFAFRQAIGSLHRPGNQTRVIVMAVGLGAFLVITVQSLQTNLLAEFDVLRRGNLPNMFLIDVQKDQVEGVEQLVSEATGVRPTLVPTVRARIAAINGEEVDLEQRDNRRERGRLGREYVVTYRPRLEANEQVVEGEFWPEAPSAEPEVSIEEGMKELPGINLGSIITFDILGRRLQARVTSVRRVDWRNSRTGFLVLFRPGVLESAPQMYIAPIDAPTAEPQRSRFQRALVERYPNVAAIDVANIVESVNRILSNITLAVSAVGGFILLAGVLILVGSIAMTKFQRIYEAAVLKTLGAERRVLLALMLVEYGLLGLVAGLVGATAATALSYAIARYVFEIEWTFAPALSMAGIAGTIALVIVVGALSSLDVLTRKPLAILRQQ